MKKKIAVLLAAVLCFSLLVGCKAAKEEAKDQAKQDTKAAGESGSESGTVEDESGEDLEMIHIGGLKGPTSMGMVKLMEDASEGTTENNYEFVIAGSADEITPQLVKGDLDMAAVPANLASVLYNNTNGAVKLMAINTLGVVYIVENGESVQSVESLKEKTIYATGKGSAPEYALRYILQQNGIDPDVDVKIEWKSEATEVVALMSNTPDCIAMMPQPFVTVAQSSVEGFRIALDLTEEWEKIDHESACLTGVLVARTEFVEKYPEQVAVFLEEYSDSAKYAVDEVQEAARLVEKYDIVKAAIAEKALPYCNITFVEGTKMKQMMEGYLKVLYDQEPKSVGGKLPGDDFYYAR